MSDKTNMAEIEKFDKLKLKKTETQGKKSMVFQKNDLMGEASRQIVMRPVPPICTVHSTSIAFLFYFF